MADTSVGVNGSVKTDKTQDAVKDKVSSQPLKPPSDKPGSSGGLAANKPFFQRPTPVSCSFRFYFSVQYTKHVFFIFI